jgi:hypothetical protein
MSLAGRHSWPAAVPGPVYILRRRAFDADAAVEPGEGGLARKKGGADRSASVMGPERTVSR